MKKLRGKHRVTIVIIFTEMLNHWHTAIHVLIQLGSCQGKDDIPKGFNYKEFNEGTSYKGYSQRGQYKDKIRRWSAQGHWEVITNSRPEGARKGKMFPAADKSQLCVKGQPDGSYGLRGRSVTRQNCYKRGKSENNDPDFPLLLPSDFLLVTDPNPKLKGKKTQTIPLVKV